MFFTVLALIINDLFYLNKYKIRIKNYQFLMLLLFLMNETIFQFLDRSKLVISKKFLLLGSRRDFKYCKPATDQPLIYSKREISVDEWAGISSLISIPALVPLHITNYPAAMKFYGGIILRMAIFFLF